MRAAARYRDVQRGGQGRHPLLAVEEVQLLRGGNEEAAALAEPLPVRRQGPQGGGSHRQQGGLAALLLPHLPAELPQGVQVPLLRQPHVPGGIPGHGPQGGGNTAGPAALPLAGEDLHPRLAQVTDQGQGHAVVDVGDDGDHSRPPSEILYA